MWRILRAIYIRIESDYLGRRPITLTEAEANGLIDRWTGAMSRDLAMLEEVMDQARAEGLGEANQRYHASSVRTFDTHELLDQILEPGTDDGGAHTSAAIAASEAVE